MRVRVHLIPTLTVHTARRAPWGTVAGCVVAAVVLTGLVASRDTATTRQVLTALRWSSVLLGAGIASVLDDPTEADLAGAGLPIWSRRVVALLVVALPTTAGWVGALVIPDRPLPWAAMRLEAAALVLLGVAVASCPDRAGPGRGRRGDPARRGVRAPHQPRGIPHRGTTTSAG